MIIMIIIIIENYYWNYWTIEIIILFNVESERYTVVNHIFYS